MDFGPDPFAAKFPDPQLEDDLAVLDEIANDLGASYIADRVSITKKKGFSSHRGQSLNNNNNNNNTGPITDDGNNINEEAEDDEKMIELIDDDDDEENETTLNNNKPLSRKSRKRKRPTTDTNIDINSDDENFMDLSNLQVPNAKRARMEIINNDYLNVSSNDNKNNIENQFDLDNLYLHSSPSMNDNTSVPITNDLDGEKLYIYYDSELTYNLEIKKSVHNFKYNKTSLSELGILQNNKSIDQLLEEIEADKMNKEMLALNEDFMADSNKNNEDNEEADELWVDKYAPKSFSDLLSSEKINREVLSWIKEWDYIVFGHKYQRRFHTNNNKYVKSKDNIESQHNVNKNKNKNLKKYSIRNNSSIYNHNNNNHSSTSTFKINKKDRRPIDQVVLLCGPPGTGKTTLAHIVANHCGYRPLEINASDDRNGKKLKELIISSCNYQPMFGDRRPPLIIMDEIDGAQNSNGDSKSAVDIILSLVRESKNYYLNNKKNKNLNSNSKKKK